MLNVIMVISILCAGYNVRAQQLPDVREQAFNIALEYELDPHLFSAIIELESAFKVSAYNAKTKDYGLGQINIHNIQALKLNKKRLLKDPEYNLRAAASILKYMERRYGYETEWYCRYNVGVGKLKGFRRKACVKYAWLVQQRLTSILIAKKE